MEDIARWVDEQIANAPALMKYASRLTRNREDAHDLLQETWQRAFERLRDSSARAPDSGHAWLRTVMTRLHLDRKRRLVRWLKRESAQLIPSFAAPVPSPEATEIASETAQRVRDALQMLNERQRAAVVLIYWEDCTQAEAARTMDISLSLFKTEFARGERRLKDILRKEQKHAVRQHV
jgi:RNA polymerase sigma factor (sigma-70 family)